jgi:hypothetical protein
MRWIDTYTGRAYRITVRDGHKSLGLARVKTYGDVVDEYRFHPESKFNATDGLPASRQARGVLGRRPVMTVRGVTVYVGKESNRIEDVKLGLVHDEEEVLATYVDPTERYWDAVVVPWMKTRTKRELAELTGLSMRQITTIRSGRSRPRSRSKQVLWTAAQLLLTNPCRSAHTTRRTGPPAVPAG